MIYDKKVAFDKSVTTVTDHFLLQEFVCKCGTCQFQKLDLMLALLLEDLRVYLGRSIKINSAYRCPMWNKQVGGKNDSTHLDGKAADIYVTGMSGLDLARAAYHVGFRRLGVADTWIHCDSLDLPKDTEHQLWVYAPMDLINVKKIMGLK